MTVHTRAQWIELGTSRLSLSNMFRVLPGIYADEEPDYMARCIAATLWKPDAVLSHGSAAWLWGLFDDEPLLVELTVPQNAQVRGPTWIRLHRRPVLRSTWAQGLPAVEIEHALLDVGATMDQPALEVLFDAAIGERVDWHLMYVLCERFKGRHGIPAIREQLRTVCPKTRSEVERKVARALTARHYRLEINARIGNYVGDLVCRCARVIVEIDGREFHTAPVPFNNDRKRQNALIDDGWRVLRYSAATAMASMDDVVEEIIAVVRKRRRGLRKKVRASKLSPSHPALEPRLGCIACTAFSGASGSKTSRCRPDNFPPAKNAHN